MLTSEGGGEATESGSAGQNLALTPMITTASEGGHYVDEFESRNNIEGI